MLPPRHAFACWLVSVGIVTAFALATAGSQELSPGQSANAPRPRASTVVLGTDNPNASPPDNDTPLPTKRTPIQILAARGNPLWSVSVSALNATRDRPLFSPSRLPPQPTRPPQMPLQAAPATAPSGPPPLALVGAIIGESKGEGMAIFVDELAKTTLRLKIGESYSGWLLQLIRGRQVVLQKEHQTAVLDLPGATPK
jgi:general secretion pathway protein N